MTRGIDRPYIPPTEFVPQPGKLDYAGAQWGVAVRDVTGRFHSTQVFDPTEDVYVAGIAPHWAAETNGTGVLYGRAVHPVFGTVAILRAVPLS